MTWFDFPAVEHLTTGTIGPPGHRVFFLQAALGDQVVSLRLEKTQVVELVRYLERLLADLPPPGPLPESMELVEPVVAEWVVGALGVSYDEVADRIVLVAEELVPPPDDTDEPLIGPAEDDEVERGVARLRATREQVSALVTHGASVVEAGRPSCNLCSQPIDPEGHACPRLNGHRQATR